MCREHIVLQTKVVGYLPNTKQPDKVIALVYWYNNEASFKEFSTHVIYPNSIGGMEALNHGNYYTDIVDAVENFKIRK